MCHFETDATLPQFRGNFYNFTMFLSIQMQRVRAVVSFSVARIIESDSSVSRT